MAIVKCPECGKDISNHATSCVHCGCKIKICPECGNAILENQNICPNCGMRSSTSPELTENLDSSAPEWKNYYKMWMADNTSIHMLKTLLNALSIIFPLIATVLLGVGIYLLCAKLNPQNTDIDKILDTRKTYETLNNLIICFSVFIFATAVTNSIKMCILPYCISLWLTNKNISACKFFKIADKDDYFDADVKEMPLANDIKTACLWADKPAEMSRGVGISLLVAIFFGLAALFLGLSLHENLESYFTSYYLFGEEFSFEYIYFVVAVIAIVVGLIANFSLLSYTERKVRAWGESIS